MYVCLFVDFVGWLEEIDLSMNSVSSDCLPLLKAFFAAKTSDAAEPRVTVHVTVNLEWNSIDEPEEVGETLRKRTGKNARLGHEYLRSRYKGCLPCG